MAAFHSGHVDKARELLNQARVGQDTVVLATGERTDSEWITRLYFEILLEEANQLIAR